MSGQIRKLLLSRRAVVLTVLAAALAARAWVFAAFIDSPLGFYSGIDSLDMSLIAAQGESFAKGHGIFSAHRVLVAAAMTLSGGGKLDINALVLVQMALGAAASCLLAACAMRLTASRLAGLASGLLAASYSPELLYETLCLKESAFHFMAALTLWTFLNACARRRSEAALFAHGAAAALLPLTRFAGLLWCILSIALLSWKSARTRTGGFNSAPILPAFVLAGALAVWLPALGWNVWKADSAQLFEGNLKYNLQVGATAEVKSYDADDKAREERPFASFLGGALLQAPSKFIPLLRAYQPPDNVNYYFMKGLLPPLELLPGPMLLIPLGVSGLLLMAMRSGWRRRRRMWVAPLHFMAFAIPVCMFVPTGRYMLALAPAYALGAGFVILSFVRACAASRKGNGIVKPCLIAGLVALAAWFAIPSGVPLREADFTSLGMALQMKEGPSENAGMAFLKAMTLSGGSPSSVLNFSKWLVDAGSPAEAANVLRPTFQRNPSNFKLLLNLTTALNRSGGAAEAERTLESSTPPASGDQRAKYFINLGVAKASLGHPMEASKCFSEALASADSEELKKLAIELLKD